MNTERRRGTEQARVRLLIHSLNKQRGDFFN